MQAEWYSDAVAQARGRALNSQQLVTIAEQLQAAGRYDLAASLYAVWLEHNADSPLAYAVYFNLGVLLRELKDLQGAAKAFGDAIQLKPDFLPAHINLGGIFDRLDQPGNAVKEWTKAVECLPSITGDNVGYKISALKEIGRVLERSHSDDQAEAALRMCLELNPNQPDALLHWLSLRQRQCRWPVVEPWGKVDRARQMAGFSALALAAYTDDPLLLLANGYLCQKKLPPTTSYADRHRVQRKAGRKLRIGYLSSDLREHAIGFLTAEVFALHDRTKVEVYAYYMGPAASDPIHEAIKASCDRWRDISALSDDQAGELMLADAVDVLVDINGYTNGARTRLLGSRPAPIIVNWLGYPGSMGSPYHHYIIADDFIIPPENEKYYSERVLRLPCYQPNNRRRVVAPEPMTREQVGLPKDGFVFCCFNGLHKITRFTWQRWMSILAAVPGSVLWLLSGTPNAVKYMSEAASNAGVDPSRIIMGKALRNPYHLARYPLADLFLDTAPYGAHTTCSDALWMGVPVITLAGRSFASRVCGSLIRSAGLPELVCNTPDHFVTTAIALATDPQKVRAYRERLLASRNSCVLFDTPLLVSRLETLYAEMWGDYLHDRLPQPDLENLEIYGEIGASLADDAIELLAVANYDDRYAHKLRERSRIWPIAPDSRLWPNERTTGAMALQSNLAEPGNVAPMSNQVLNSFADSTLRASCP